MLEILIVACLLHINEPVLYDECQQAGEVRSGK